jgi:outer membrane protein OmpA-like peptidoglycan-associated protein
VSRRAWLPAVALLVAAAPSSWAQSAPSPGPVDSAPVLDVVAPVLDIVLSTSPLDGSVTDSIGEDIQSYVLAADVFFAFGSADLTPQASEELARIAGQIADSTLTQVTVTGHTDGIGDARDNQGLSERRAESVRVVLAEALPGVALDAVGRGEQEPVAEETTEDGQDDPEARARNRRVVISGS